MTRKAIFDAARAAGADFNRPGNMGILDTALTAIGIALDKPEKASAEMRVSPAGIALIQEFEGYAKARPDGSVEAYPDPATGGAPWTIGWGSTTDESGQPVKAGTVWSKDRAAARFADHVGEFAEQVWSLVKDVPTKQNQFDSLVSFAYNVGADIDADTVAEGLGDSTLLKKHRAGDYAGAQAQFAAWNKAAGKVMPGLTRRRAAEAALYGHAA